MVFIIIDINEERVIIMNFGHDGSGNAFIELFSGDYGGKKEFIRLTRVEKGVGEPNIRFQIRETNGRLRAMGPEFPIDGDEDIVKAILKMKSL
jgi:hypothetical protein